MSLKEVENPEQDWLAQFCTDPDRKEREQRIKALLKRVRDAIEALSREECDDFIEYLDLVGRRGLRDVPAARRRDPKCPILE